MSLTLNSPMALCRYLITHNRTIPRIARTSFDNTLVYLFNKKPSRGPLFVAWTVTYRCNAQCSFCDTHELGRALHRDLDTEEALKLIRQIGAAGVWHLSLTGGEPLIRQDLEQLIRESKRVGLIVNINTNGSLLAKKAEMLVDAGVDIILFDNMAPSKIGEAVEIVKELENSRDAGTSGAILTEASGNITIENVEEYAKVGVGRISVGMITHSARALDISFDISYKVVL